MYKKKSACMFLTVFLLAISKTCQSYCIMRNRLQNLPNQDFRSIAVIQRYLN